MKKSNSKLSPNETEKLFKTLKTRFEKNMNRHKGIDWIKVETKLKAKPEKLWSLNEMENTGGEPDVVSFDNLPSRQAGKKGEYVFYDCAAESPKGRRSFCYDRKALDARKENKPKNNAMDMAIAIGIEMLTEEALIMYSPITMVQNLIIVAELFEAQ